MTTALMLLLIVSCIFFMFSGMPYSDWINFLFHAPAGLLIWLSLIVNLILLSYRIINERLVYVQPSPAYIRDMDLSAEIADAGAADLQTIAAWMKKHRFNGKILDNSLHGQKGRYSFLPGTLFRTGLILTMISLLFSAYLRKSEDKTVHHKETHSFLGRQVSIESVDSNLSGHFLQTAEGDTFALKTVSALLRAGEDTVTITSGFPVKFRGLYYRIRDIGYSQEIVIHTPEERIEKRLGLNILPPGRIDNIPLSSSDGLMLTFALHPERTFRKGLLEGKEYSLSNPHYDVVIQRGKLQEKAERFIVKPGESIKSGGQSVTFGNNSLFITVQAVADPALFWIYAGILLTLAGILLILSRFFWYTKQVAAVFDGTTLHVGYGEEFFRKWATQKFHNWLRRNFHNRNIYL